MPRRLLVVITAEIPTGVLRASRHEIRVAGARLRMWAAPGKSPYAVSASTRRMSSATKFGRSGAR